MAVNLSKIPPYGHTKPTKAISQTSQHPHAKLLPTSIKDVTWASAFSACTAHPPKIQQGGRPIGPIKLEGWAFLLALATAKLELWGHSSLWRRLLEIESCSFGVPRDEAVPRGQWGRDLNWTARVPGILGDLLGWLLFCWGGEGGFDYCFIVSLVFGTDWLCYVNW